MKFTTRWLERHWKKKINIEQIIKALEDLHLELDSVIKIGGDGFCVGEILAIKKHPNSEKLNICEVAYEHNGIKKIQEIVCGAPNVRVGLGTILALSGAQLPCGAVLSDRNIRGIVSGGMLLSYEEFGLKHIKQEDIIDENPDILKQLVQEDYIITIGLPANRVDLSSVRGLAMELASYFNIEMKDLYTERPLANKNSLNSTDTTIENEDFVHVFSTMEIRNFQLRNNYHEIASLLYKVANPVPIPVINVANYITWDLGVPLHIYNLEKVHGLHLNLLKKEEKFTTLNGEEILLQPHSMVLQDKNNKTLVVAGIVGGLHSACTHDTKNILVEIAIFNKKYYIPAYRDLNIQNTSTYYFNRGINYFHYMLALEYFREFLTGDYSSIKVINNRNIAMGQKCILLSYELFYNVTGLSVSFNHIKSLLERYQYKVNILNRETDGLNNEMTLEIVVPMWKNHITSGHDIIEEIIRISANNIIENKDLRLEESAITATQEDSMEILFKVKDLFVFNGYKEIISYSFSNNANKKNTLYIPNAIGDDKYLRSSLKESMEEYLENMVYNKLGMEYNGRLFEISKVFKDDGVRIKEYYNLSIGILKNIHRYPVRDIKNEFVNIISKLSSMLHINIRLSPDGEIKINNEISGRVYVNNNYLVGELENFDSFINVNKNNKKHNTGDAPYVGPIIIRDYSCLMDWEQLQKFFAELNKVKKHLHYSLFDYFKDAKETKESYGIRLKYLTEDEKIYKKLETDIFQVLKKQNITLR